MFTPSISEEQHCEAVRQNMVSKTMELAGDILYFGMNRIGALVFIAIISFSSIEYLKESQTKEDLVQYEQAGMGIGPFLSSGSQNIHGPLGENINVGSNQVHESFQLKTNPIVLVKKLGKNLVVSLIKTMLGGSAP